MRETKWSERKICKSQFAITPHTFFPGVVTKTLFLATGMKISQNVYVPFILILSDLSHQTIYLRIFNFAFLKLILEKNTSHSSDK